MLQIGLGHEDFKIQSTSKSHQTSNLTANNQIKYLKFNCIS
jgi:hypothetical protein